MAHLLGIAVKQNWQGAFIKEMLLTFSVPVVCSSNPTKEPRPDPG